MNTHQDNIRVDSCQYTPVYLVQDTGAIQGSYIVAQGNVEEVKPVTNNLKRFYENSGIFESNAGNNSPNISKPRILQRKDSKLTGNNLKLASFLIPKTSNSHIQENNISKQCLAANNFVLKPTMVSSKVVNTMPKVDIVNTVPQVEVVNTVPKVEIVNTMPKVEIVNTVSKVEVDRKIVKLKDFPSAINLYNKPPRERTLPKKKPKEEYPPITNPIKHTSVQLLKLGETYHSLNQLSDDQMKMVNQALKIFNDPEKIAALEPTYDPVTNTRFLYKVVSPKDLTVVGKNKFVVKKKKEVTKDLRLEKEILKDLKKEKEISNDLKKVKEIDLRKEKEILKDLRRDKEISKDLRKEKSKPEIAAIFEQIHDESEEEPEPPIEVKVTRSGRKVKLPKQMVPEKTPHKPKKKAGAIASCFQCSTEFCSLYRLQKHYENQPTHIPAKVHSNLFHCLLAIVKSGSDQDRSNIFIQQLEQLIEKLKSLLPCLLKKIDGSEGKSCTINEDIGRLFGMNAGKYNLNVDALNCVKDKDGNCRHKPPKTNHLKSDPCIPSQIWLDRQNDDIKLEEETKDCAKINAVDKWPPGLKRLCNSKQQKSQQFNAKKMRLTSENMEPKIDLEIEKLVNFNHDDQSEINVQSKYHLKSDPCIPSQIWLDIQNDDIKLENETKDCARINAVDKWPPAHKRLCDSKQQKSQQFNAKKIILTSENMEPKIDLEIEDLVNFNHDDQSAIKVQPKSLSILDDLDLEVGNEIPIQKVNLDSGEDQSNKLLVDPTKKCSGAHTRFHSTHFDIRSSPIKSSAAVFRKFQINPEKLAKYDVQIISPMELDNKEAEISESNSMPSKPCSTDTPDLQSIFTDDLTIQLSPCKSSGGIPPDLSFDTSKDWIIEAVNDKSIDSFIKTNSDLEPSLLHVQEGPTDNIPIENLLDANGPLGDSNSRLLSSQSSVLNFLESLGSECLSYPETEIRNNSVENVDFQLDLFSFSNT